jgi:methyl-accepting chemotaxis protein
MRRMQSLSIRWKLTFIAVFAGVVAQAFAGLGMGVYDAQTYRTQKMREVSSEAEILAASLAASLEFNDSKAAHEYLDALRANPEIEIAGAYAADGTLLAGYSRVGPGRQLPDKAPSVGLGFNGEDLTVAAPVTGPTGTLGTVFLQATVESPTTRLLRYGGILLLAILGSLAFVVPISIRLNSAISRVIREIAEAASRVTAGDLSVRLTSAPRADEIGVLVVTFDQMVASLREMTGAVTVGAKLLADAASEILSTTTHRPRRGRRSARPWWRWMR